MNDIIYQSACALARALRARELSSRELVEACLARIEQVNPQINAVVQLAAERALDEADACDRLAARGEFRGALHGVPITLKDSLDTAGIISTGGTMGRRSYVPQRDAPVVARLRAAGAVLLGKTKTPEPSIPVTGRAVPVAAAVVRRRLSPAGVRRWSSVPIPVAASANPRTCAGLPASSRPRGARRAAATSCPMAGSWTR